MDMKKFGSLGLRSGVCLVALMASGVCAAAGAQTDEPSSSDKEIVLGAVTVTAQKRAENIQDVPISITAMSDEELQQHGAASLRDLQFIVPNLTLYSRDDFNPNFIIRGISSGARNIGFESSVGVYVDGVFMGRTSGSIQQLDDIASVEVLRGPQGTLYGKNTISGAINVTTKRPGDTFEGRALVEMGNYNHLRLSGYASGPVIKDKVFAKVSGFTSKRDGFIENVNPAGPADLDNEDIFGFRTEVRFTPIDNLDIAVRGDWSKADRQQIDKEVDEITFNPGFPLAGPVPGPRTVNMETSGAEKREISGGSVTATYDFASGHELVSISALRDIDYALPDIDLDYEPFSFLGADYKDTLSQFTQEIRLVSPDTGRLRYVLGAYYFDQTSETTRKFILGDDLKALLGVPAFVPLEIADSGSIDTQTFAVFANFNYDLTERLQLDFGLRYNDEKKSLVFGQEGLPALGFPTVLPGTDEVHDSDISPTVGLNFKVNENTLVYGRYARGFKSGGWNADLLSDANLAEISFEPEQIDSYEVGVKTELFNDRVRANVALFNLNYQDIQVSVFEAATGRFATRNAAEATSQGFELEVSAKATRELELTLGVGYADASYDSYVIDALTDRTGEALDAPKWTFGASLNYERPISSGLSFASTIDYAYRGETPGEGHSREVPGLPSFDTFDGRAGLVSDAGWSVFLWGKNLTDDDYLTNRFVGGNLLGLIGVEQRVVNYGSPRTYGVAMSYDF